MGFYINEFENELKQHLNLSEQAWLIVNEDIRNFYYDQYKSSMSGFLNRIFYNFYQLADATISLRCIDRRRKLEELFGSSAISDDVTKQNYIDLLMDEYKKNLIAKSNSYPKSEGKKFRINKENLEILKSSADSVYYDGSIGLYFKAVIEEYANKKMCEREAIFFSETIEIINYAIQNKKKIKISQYPTVISSSMGVFGRKYYVSPYKILTDKVSMFNYLICFAEEIGNDGNIQKKMQVSFRINKISKIDIMRSMSGFISVSEKRALDYAINEKTPQFMAGDVIDIKVTFTAKGLEDFERLVYLRPSECKQLDEKTYEIRCTEFQARNYFFNFGKDAIIIEPKDLKEKLEEKYSSALEAYTAHA